jgi:PIN domain nuclease of toxin-antitoxin system
MLILLDTHILITVTSGEGDRLPPFMQEAIRSERNAVFASVLSLWELAIKHRLGKLPLSCPLEDWPAVLSASAISLMDIVALHALAEVSPAPDTKDPFDRLLLAICQVEKMRLVTLDRSLLSHPLVLRSAA